MAGAGQPLISFSRIANHRRGWRSTTPRATADSLVCSVQRAAQDVAPTSETVPLAMCSILCRGLAVTWWNRGGETVGGSGSGRRLRAQKSRAGMRRGLEYESVRSAYFFFVVVAFDLSGACVRTDPAKLFEALVDDFWDRTFPASEARSLDDFSFFAMMFSPFET